VLEVGASDFESPDVPQEFALDFETTQPWPDIEFRVLGREPGTVLTDRVEVSRLLE
jgi:hypothetical protein